MKPARTGPASAARAAVRAVFPFSLRGFLLTLLAAALLALGLFRADLAALFWGASFILYALYALTGSHLARLSLRRRRTSDPELVSIVLPSSGLQPGRAGEALLSARLPRSLPPGFFVRFSLPLHWHDRVLRSVTSRLGHGRTETSVRFRAARRGLYRSEAANLEIQDVLGFTANLLPVPLAESLAVFPSPSAEGPWRLLTEGDNPAASRSTRRRSEELLEVRKYYPGDDVRRLNWKVFAHSRELFLRIGEETPPPESRLLFVLDSSENPLVPRFLSDDYLDGLVDACASAMEALAAEGMSVLLCRPGSRECRAYSSEARTDLLTALADVWWADSGWRPALPSIHRIHCVVFSTPGSPGLGPIMSQLRDRGWGASLFLKEPPPVTGFAGMRLRDLLFVTDGDPGTNGGSANGLAGHPEGRRRARGPAVSLLERKARASLEEALARDLSEYGSAAWKAGHARKI